MQSKNYPDWTIPYVQAALSEGQFPGIGPFCIMRSGMPQELQICVGNMSIFVDQSSAHSGAYRFMCEDSADAFRCRDIAQQLHSLVCNMPRSLPAKETHND